MLTAPSVLPNIQFECINIVCHIDLILFVTSVLIPVKMFLSGQVSMVRLVVQVPWNHTLAIRIMIIIHHQEWLHKIGRASCRERV